MVKDEHYLVKRAVNFFLVDKGETLYLHKNVRELLFDGYDDRLIDIALKLNISGINLPFTKFGWFAEVSTNLPIIYTQCFKFIKI